MADSLRNIRRAAAGDGEFLADDHGYGYVSPDISELTIAAAWRGRGLGRALLRAMASLAAAAGSSQISLST